MVALGGLHILGTERHESRRIETSSAAAPDVKAIGLPRVFTCR